MATKYYILARLNDELVRVDSTHGRQLMVLAVLRKPKACATCEQTIARGAKAWRDLTGCAYNRSHRIHPGCLVDPYL